MFVPALASTSDLAHSDTSIILVLFKVLDLFLEIGLIFLRTHLPNS